VGEGIRAILDTSVVIATDIAPLEGELQISAITLAKLHVGIFVATRRKVHAERLRRLLVLQSTFNALPADEAVEASYGQIAAAVGDAGRQPRARSVDLLIAARAASRSPRPSVRCSTKNILTRKAASAELGFRAAQHRILYQRVVGATSLISDFRRNKIIVAPSRSIGG
jgi:toxin FitB